MKKLLSVVLLSALFLCIFSACSGSEPVQWEDEKFRRLVYEAMEKDPDEEITARELKKYRQLFLVGDKKLFFGISSDIRPEGTGAAANGQYSYNGVLYDQCTDMSLDDLAKFTELTNIVVIGVNTKNLHFTADMSQLESIHMENCSVQDISALVYCEKLEEVSANGGGIEDISALAGKEKLWYVSLAHNRISDISPLADMDLQREKSDESVWVDLSYNNISDISPLLGRDFQLSEKLPPYMHSLIDLSYNYISDLTPFEGHNHIGKWVLDGNLITDGTPLLKVNLSVNPGDNWNSVSLYNNPAESFYNLRAFTGKLHAESHKLEKPQPVEWQDKEFERMLRLRLGKTEGPIYASELRGITNLYVMGDYMAVNGLDDSYKGVNLATRRDYNDYFVLLEYKNGKETDGPPQKNGNIKSLADLANFPDLVYCMVSYQQIENLDMPKAMPSVETLILRNNRINDITGIINFSSVRSLSLACNNITDITPLGTLYLPRVHTLDLKRNEITDISILQNLNAPGYVNLMMNNITDVSALGKVPQISMLYLDYNNISDISFLESCNTLYELHLQGNPISDYSPLKHLPTTAKVYGRAN